ncbi:MAG TPA: hypothetical protein VE890_07840, partial [Thermoguttaceae bacterium]|nr:hypothetical protein [Thermoguttaceae bacterium]
MAVGTNTPLQDVSDAVAEPPSTEQEVFIEKRLSQTQRHVRGVDLAVGLIGLGIGLLAYLLVAALIDHWMVTGGLGTGGRMLLWLGLLVAGGFYAFRAVIPSLIYQINPIFAAQTIERSKPSLKNSLINFLMMRGHRREIQPVVYRALQQRAVADLSQVELEVAVDRRHVIRLGYVLAAMLAVFCLYLVISPKSPLTSAARIVFPWANISAPTRVTIEEIRPGQMTGDKAAFHGEFVMVSAEVEGLDDDELVVLYFSTGDARDVDQAVPMTIPKDAYRYQCKLPADSRGLQQGLEYYLKAGDCTTERFTIEVQTAPAILVESIDYDYPAYTGIADRTVQRQGDIRAIEGTTITLRATANQEIKRAEIDFDCDSLRGRPMIIAGKQATGHFVLELKADDPTLPWHDCYQLRFTDQAGRENRRPIRHEIEVIRDLPPQVQLIDPQEEEVQLVADGRLEIQVQAEDPDYLLSRVTLHVEHGGRDLNTRPLLDKPHQGEFQQAYLFDPNQLGL